MKEEEKWVFFRERNMEFGGVVFENREVRRMKKNFSLKEGMVVRVKSVYTGSIILEMRYMLDIRPCLANGSQDSILVKALGF